MEALKNEKSDIKKKVVDIQNTIDELEDEVYMLKLRKKEIKGLIGNLKTTYDIDTILNMLKIKDETKEEIKNIVDSVTIYHEYGMHSGKFVISYYFNGNRVYFWHATRPDDWYYETNIIYGNSCKTDKSFNIVKLYNTLDYNNINKIGFLENHLKLATYLPKDRLGMLLIAYFFFIAFKQYKLKGDIVYKIMELEGMKKMKEMMQLEKAGKKAEYPWY